MNIDALLDLDYNLYSYYVSNYDSYEDCYEF